MVSPENSGCRSTWLFRLNLDKGQEYKLEDEDLELTLYVTEGKIRFSIEGEEQTIRKLDSFYIPAKIPAQITALEASFCYIGGAPYEGIGETYIRKYDADLTLGDIRQVHGEAPFKRDVFMCLADAVPASRLICGVTWADKGKGTSWPPHQHSTSLEEVYCYFDIPSPKFALHLSSRKKGIIESVHPVSTGDCVIIPEGYHPTVGMPGVKSRYYRVMTAHSRKNRSYNLSIVDFI